MTVGYIFIYSRITELWFWTRFLFSMEKYNTNSKAIFHIRWSVDSRLRRFIDGIWY